MDSIATRSSMDVVLLPGLDGTGKLFDRFVEKSPEWANPTVISYDRDRVRGYRELATHVLESIHPERKFLLVAESFSGPVALLVAAKTPENLIGVVLCASFASNPRPLLSALFSPALFRRFFQLRLPAWAIRQYLTGWSASSDLVRAAATVVQSVSPSVLAARVGMVIETDVSPELSKCVAPLLYIAAKQDRLVTKRSAAALTAAKSDISLAEIDGPHFIVQSRPVAVWRTISEFVGNHAPVSGDR